MEGVGPLKMENQAVREHEGDFRYLTATDIRSCSRSDDPLRVLDGSVSLSTPRVPLGSFHWTFPPRR